MAAIWSIGTDGGVVGHDIRLNFLPLQIFQLTQSQLPEPGHFEDLNAGPPVAARAREPYLKMLGKS